MARPKPLVAAVSQQVPRSPGAREASLGRVQKFVRRGVAAAGIALAAMLVLAPEPQGFPPSALPTAAAIVLFFTFWLTKLVPDNLAALLLFVFAGVVVELPLEIVFSGFQSPAVWLIFGGLIISAAIQHSELGERVARVVIRFAPRNYAGLTYGLFLSGVALTLILPTAVGRMVLLVPIAMAVASRAGLEPGSRGHDGLVLSAALSALLPAYAFLPSTAPNVILLGAAQNTYGVDFTYFRFWLVNFPVLIAATIIVLPGLIVALFREEADFSNNSGSREPLTTPQRRTAAILMVTLALWATDALHGISPTWVALGCAAALILPAAGALNGASILQDANTGAWLLIAAMVSLGAMGKFTGLDDSVGRTLVNALPFARGEPILNFGLMVAVGVMTGLCLTTLAAPVIMTGLAQYLAAATGWSLEAVLFAQIPTWVFFPLPHQTPILIIGMVMAGVSFGRVVALLCTFTTIGFSAIVPLHFLWLQALGYIP